MGPCVRGGWNRGALCLVAFGPGCSPDHPGEAVSPRLQATWRASPRPDPAIFPHRVPTASRTSSTSSQPLALAAENEKTARSLLPEDPAGGVAVPG